MIIKSDTTGITYDDMDCVFFKNYVQAAAYVSWGARLIDVFVDGSMKWVFVFEKETHARLKDKWGTKDKNYKNENV